MISLVSSAFCLAKASATAWAMVLASAVSLDSCSQSLASLEVPGFVLTHYKKMKMYRKWLLMAFNSVLNFCTSVQSSEALCVLVVDDLDLNAFSSPESSPQQINSLLTSPICSDCSLWSQKKSEYLKSS